MMSDPHAITIHVQFVERTDQTENQWLDRIEERLLTDHTRLAPGHERVLWTATSGHRYSATVPLQFSCRPELFVAELLRAFSSLSHMHVHVQMLSTR